MWGKGLVCMYKVMIADDEPFVVHGLSSRIDWESLNMELVGTASNGQDVLAAMARSPVQLLITDVRMPHMDGLSLIARAKQLNPSLRCIVISAYSEFDYVKKALQHGVENYLLKPINENELLETLSKTLDNLNRDRVAHAPTPQDAIAFRTNILDRWVNGTIQDFELFERAELLRIDLSAAAYRVCVFDVVHGGGREPFACASELSELCRGMLFPAYGGECFIDGSLRVVLILHGEGAEDGREEQLRAALLRVSREAAVRGITTFVSVSRAAIASAGVGECYASAVLHRLYRFVDPAAQAVFCMRFPDSLEAAASAEVRNDSLHFGAALKEGDVRQAQLLAKQALARLANEGNLDLREGMLPLILCLVRTVIESGRVSDELPGTLAAQLAGFAGTRSREELQQWLLRTIEDAIQAIGKRKGSFHLLVHLTLEQINKKYDAELSLKMLASGFNVSPAYLGQLFKEETGVYFNDYLTQARLAASRALLLDTDMKIAEIVGRVGIPNQSYFNRVFKKTYGLSPVEFRRQSLQRKPS